MKRIFEEGDVVFYEGKAVTVQTVGINAISVRGDDDRITLVPSWVLKTMEDILIESCLTLLDKYSKWEARLSMDENCEALTFMSPENMNKLLELQDERNRVAKQSITLERKVSEEKEKATQEQN